MSTLILLPSVALLQIQEQPCPVYDQPIDDTYRLRITATYAETSPGICCATPVRMWLVDRTDPGRSWEIATLSDKYAVEITQWSEPTDTPSSSTA